MSYINTRTKADRIREAITGSNKKQTFKEWAEELGVKGYEVSNALYTFPEVKEKHIRLERNRKFHKLPIKIMLQKLKDDGKEKYTCEEMAKITGFTQTQIRSALKIHPEMAEYYVKKGDVRDDEILTKFKEHWFGNPRMISDWCFLTGLDTATIRRKQKFIESHFGDFLIEKTEWRVEEIHRLAGQKTLTEWSEYFEIDITAMHHFFTRKGLHHLRKNPPKKYL